jgi:hypothetical protein
LDYLAKALVQRKKRQLETYAKSDNTTWDTENLDPENADNKVKPQAGSSEVDTIVSKVIERLKQEGINVGKGESASKLIQEFAKDFTKKGQAPARDDSSRKDYETPDPTGVGKNDYGSSEGRDYEDSPEDRLRDALEDEPSGDSSMAGQARGHEPISEETMRIIREGLDESTVNDIKRNKGKAKGLYQRAQKYMAKTAGKM